MRLSRLKNLIEVNIIYSSQDSNITNLRKKQAKNPTKKISVGFQLMRTYLFVGVLYLFLFGVPALFMPFKDFPGIFTNMVTIFYIFIFAQGFLSFYNVFYESKDLQAYRPYAFRESEIMVAKGVAVLLPTLMGILPILAYVLVLDFQAQNIFLALPIALVSLVLIFASLVFFLVISVHFVTKTAFFRRYKQIASTILLTLGYVVSFGAIFMVNGSNRFVENGSLDQAPYFYPLTVFHTLAVRPFSIESLLGVGAWILVVLAMYVVIKRKVIPEFYEAALATSTEKTVQSRKSSFGLDPKKGLKDFVFRYHLGLIGQGTVFIQSVLVSAIMPYFFLYGFLLPVMRNGGRVEFLTLHYLLPLLFVTFLIATVTSAWGMSLTSIGISLERENFNYLKTLPFHFFGYLKQKFWILFLLQSILPLLIFSALSLFLGMTLPLLFLLLVFWLVVSLAWSSWSYYRDFKHLVTNWGNVTELMNRENGMVKMMYGIILVIGVMIIIGVSFYLASILPSISLAIISVFIMAVLGIVSFLTHRYYLQKLKVALENG